MSDGIMENGCRSCPCLDCLRNRFYVRGTLFVRCLKDKNTRFIKKLDVWETQIKYYDRWTNIKNITSSGG